MKWILIAGCILGWSLVSAQEQERTQVTNSFKFNDGVYLSFEAFQKNKPDYSWIALAANSVVNSEKQIIKLEWLKKKGDTGVLIPIDSIWGICVSGTPYIHVEKDKRDFGTFSALKVRGKICYYIYETTVTEMVDIKAYNPVTGRPFRSAKLPRNRNVVQDMMLDFVSGRVAAFNRANLMEWVREEDQALWITLMELSEEEAQEKLFKCLQIYDDRNPVFVVN